MTHEDTVHQLEENIYCNEDFIRRHRASHLTLKKCETQYAGPSDRGLYAGATVFVGLLCGFLLILLILMSDYYNRVIAERDHCLLDLNASQIISAEKDLLQISYETCKEDKKRLQETQERLYSCAMEQICPEHWRQFRCKCYYISTDQRNWNGSREDCRNRGADLVIIDDIKEQEFISRIPKRLWIGLNDAETEGTWKWVDDTLLNKDLQFWESGEPNEYEQPEDCVESRVRNINITLKSWNDLPCSENHYWICEKDLQRYY